MVPESRTALVDEIRSRKLSRNRNFDLLSRPEYRSAMRLARYLDGIAEAIRRGVASGDLNLAVRRMGGGRVRLRLRHGRIRAVRQCHLSRAELECLLRHHPDVATLVETRNDSSGRLTHVEGASRGRA